MSETNTQAAAQGAVCCPADAQAACCAPEEKAACCGAGGGSCGCI